jgi:hypothetical protein
MGGVEVLAAEFLPALQQRGYEFVVIVPQSGPDRPQEDKVQRHSRLPISVFDSDDQYR